MPGGADYYAYLVERQTTTEMTPDEIHQLGLSEVARIKKGMEEIKNQVGFKEPLAKFFDYIRTDPTFNPERAKALGDGYRAIGEREIGRAHVCTPVTHAHLVCRLLLEK